MDHIYKGFEKEKEEILESHREIKESIIKVKSKIKEIKEKINLSEKKETTKSQKIELNANKEKLKKLRKEMKLPNAEIFFKDKTINLLNDYAINALPNKPQPFHLPSLDINTVERIGTDIIKIQLKNGRVFFGHRSEERQYLWYSLFKTIIPKIVDADSLKLALDIQTRYFKKDDMKYLPKGGTFIEGGCFTGLKAINWHDKLEGDCKIIAVEIGKPNFEIMKMNIEANDIKNIKPVNAGLWSENGYMEQKLSHSTRRFLEKTDQWEKSMKYSEKVETLTIDSLLDQNEVEIADYMNVQVNGAELEVMKGITNLNRIKVFGIASYYSKKGIRNRDLLKNLLISKGCSLLQEGILGRLTFVTPKWKEEILNT